MRLHGHPACINTAKCLQTAAEKGIDVESQLINGPDEVRSLSPLGVVPVLQDLDNVVCGTGAIMSYLDDKGFGPSLVPRNGVVRAFMYQWIIVATELAQPQAAAMKDGGGDREALKLAYSELAKAIEEKPCLPQIAHKGEFIGGDFTLADIHWAAISNMIICSGGADVIDSNGTIKNWLEAVKAHPSTSKEKIIPYTFLPTSEDISAGNLRNVGINVV